MLLSGSFNSHSTIVWLLQATGVNPWVKLVSPILDPRTRTSQDPLHSLRSSGLNHKSWQPYTVQLLFKGLSRNTICPPAACSFISDSINLILSFWGYLLEVLYVRVVPIICFPLNKHLFTLSIIKQCWLSRQDWIKAGILPGWSREQPLKASIVLMWHRHTFSEGAWVMGWASSRLSLACSERLGSSAGLCKPVSAKTTETSPAGGEENGMEIRPMAT